MGANASGKSNFLEAFRFLRDIALSGSSFREAVVHPRRAGVSGIRCLAARQYPDVEIAVQLEEEGVGAAWEYEIAFHQDKQLRPRIRRERVSRGDDALVDRPNDEDFADPERGRTEGPAFTSRLIEYATDRWRPDIAARRAESLRRAVACLQRLSSA